MEKLEENVECTADAVVNRYRSFMQAEFDDPVAPIIEIHGCVLNDVISSSILKSLERTF